MSRRGREVGRRTETHWNEPTHAPNGNPPSAARGSRGHGRAAGAGSSRACQPRHDPRAGDTAGARAPGGDGARVPGIRWPWSGHPWPGQRHGGGRHHPLVGRPGARWHRTAGGRRHLPPRGRGCRRRDAADHHARHRGHRHERAGPRAQCAGAHRAREHAGRTSAAPRWIRRGAGRRAPAGVGIGSGDRRLAAGRHHPGAAAGAAREAHRGHGCREGRGPRRRGQHGNEQPGAVVPAAPGHRYHRGHPYPHEQAPGRRDRG